jgi:hypothetical protein
MPHEALVRYLKEIEDSVGDLQECYVELYEEEFLTPERVDLRIRVRYYNGCLLEINESVVQRERLEHLGYRYHFQDKKNELIFRYDNTPHFPNLPDFPQHKHHPAGVDPSDSPSVLRSIKEAADISARYGS